jgi:hypothetical protein
VVISCAVRWYFRFSLSLRDIEELLLDRGAVVTYEKRSVAGAAFAPLSTPSPTFVKQGLKSPDYAFLKGVKLIHSST